MRQATSSSSQQRLTKALARPDTSRRPEPTGPGHPRSAEHSHPAAWSRDDPPDARSSIEPPGVVAADARGVRSPGMVDAADPHGHGPPGSGDPHRNRPPDPRANWAPEWDGSAPDPTDLPLRPSVSARAAALAALLAVVALVVAVPRALSSDPQISPVPPRPAVSTAPAPTAPGADVQAPAPLPSAGATSGPGATSSPGAVLLVHVAGQVRRAGVVRLPTGARVADALHQAGGPTRRADLAAINLARPVVDGEQVFVPEPGETPPAGAAASAGQPGAPASGSAPGAPLDLNTADEAALDALPGVGPVIAGRIVAWRQQHGRFTSVEELTEVSGIGEATLEKLRPLVRT